MVRILVASRRPWAAEALATSSYETNFDQPLSADTLVSAAVSVVLPWSIWPMVPTLACGFFLSNFALPIVLPPVTNLPDKARRERQLHRRARSIHRESAAAQAHIPQTASCRSRGPGLSIAARWH